MRKLCFETKKMEKIPFTGIRKVFELANRLEVGGKSVIHFEIGQPDFDTPLHIKQSAKKALDQGMVRYTSNYGIPVLRHEIAKKLEKINGIKVDPESEIMVTTGGEEGIAAVLLALLDPGDEVLVTDPAYSPYYSLVRLAAAVPVPVPIIEEEGYLYDFNALEKAITPKTKMLILNSPNNPTGAVLGRKHLEKLANFCQRRNLMVLADEAYDQIIYDNTEHISFATLPGMASRTVTVLSFSKTYSMTGWRVGYVVAPREIISVVVRAHQNLVLSATSFAQAGAVAALTGPQEPLEIMVREFDRRRKLMYEGLKEMGIPCHKSPATFYLFPNISQFGMDSWDFANLLLKKYGVATVPGVEFGQNGEGHIRISYATSYKNCEEGLIRIQKAVKNLR